MNNEPQTKFIGSCNEECIYLVDNKQQILHIDNCTHHYRNFLISSSHINFFNWQKMHSLFTYEHMFT